MVAKDDNVACPGNTKARLVGEYLTNDIWVVLQFAAAAAVLA
jgi:hypothetical protein